MLISESSLAEHLAGIDSEIHSSSFLLSSFSLSLLRTVRLRGTSALNPVTSLQLMVVGAMQFRVGLDEAGNVGGREKLTRARAPAMQRWISPSLFIAFQVIFVLRSANCEIVYLQRTWRHFHHVRVHVQQFEFFSS